MAEKGLRAVMLGLDQAGKTRILYRLALNEAINTTTTVGFNVETIVQQNCEVTIYEVGGSANIRPLWRHYYTNLQALIFVVDSHDPSRVRESGPVLQELLENESLRDYPTLILANKCDLSPEVDIGLIKSWLNIDLPTDRPIKILKCSSETGEGLSEGIDWLIQSSSLVDLQKKEEVKVEKVAAEVKKFRVMLLGMQGTGKTVFLYRQKLNNLISSVPTIGFNVETITYKNSEFLMWDIGGNERIRNLWSHYYESTQAVMFFIDSAEPSSFNEARELLGSVLVSPELDAVPLVIVANKEDLEGSVSIEEISNALDVENIKATRKCTILKSSSMQLDLRVLDTLHEMLVGSN